MNLIISCLKLLLTRVYFLTCGAYIKYVPFPGGHNPARDNLDPRDYFRDYFKEIMRQTMNGGGYGTLDLPKVKPTKTRGGQRFLGGLFKIPLDILCKFTGGVICFNKPPGGGGIGVGPGPEGPEEYLDPRKTTTVRPGGGGNGGGMPPGSINDCMKDAKCRECTMNGVFGPQCWTNIRG